MQTFQAGDLVFIAEKVPSYMSHFPHDCKAVVLYSYHDKYEQGSKTEYALQILPDGYFSAWFEEGVLTLLERHRFDLLPDGNQIKNIWLTMKEQSDGNV